MIDVHSIIYETTLTILLKSNMYLQKYDTSNAIVPPLIRSLNHASIQVTLHVKQKTKSQYITCINKQLFIILCNASVRRYTLFHFSKNI